jgi:SPP1 gp7 family putative phage head morphogenesis protein
MAAKAIPGGARPTPAPQGSVANSTGGISPLAYQLSSEAGYANAYSGFLPRPPLTFTQGAFGPFSPILPAPVDEPPPGAARPTPRRYEFEVGWNLPVGQPGTEGIKLADFNTLKTLADLYCLSPETRTLCSDLTWRPLSSISVGDELLAFDEEVPGPRLQRKLRRATVTSCEKITRPCYRIRFADGREVVASAEHRWLTGRTRGSGAQACPECSQVLRSPAGLGAHRKFKHGVSSSWDQDWILTANLRPGASVKDLGAPWAEDGSREAGYLAGLIDGEGSISGRGAGAGYQIQFAQRPGTVMDVAERLLKERNYWFRRGSQGASGVDVLLVSGLYDCLRLLGEIRPLRLLDKANAWLEGRSAYAHTGGPRRGLPHSRGLLVESVEFVGEREVIAIGTSTQTLFAEGLFSHNSVARTCIQRRKAEIRGLEWDIIPTSDAAKAYRGDHGAMRDFGERRARAIRFFRHPDPNYFSFSNWLDTILEEIFVFDALTLLARPKWGKGMGKGLLGSDLDCLQLINGPTIRPLVDLHGAVPRPPAPAYQQYLYGVPRSDYMTLITNRDIEDGGLEGAEVNQYRGDQMMYLPMTPRAWTPYGFPPIERALIPVMSGLQKQAYQLDYFREGTIPAVYISPGDVNITPNQIRELQDALNAIAGDPAWKHKVIVLPPGSKVDPQKPTEVADQFDEIVMTQVCMAFDISPMELGIIPQVSTVASPFAAREMAQSQRAIHQRTSTKPLLLFLTDIFNTVLHRIVGQDDMQFTFEGIKDDSQQHQLTDLLVEQVQNGLCSVDEARTSLQLQPWGLPETSGPVVFTTLGPVPFGSVPVQPVAGGGNEQSGNDKQKPGTIGGGRVPPRGAQPTTQTSSAQWPTVMDTPAHAAAEGVNTVPSEKPGTTAVHAGSTTAVRPGATTAGRGNRAVKSELEALRRHLNKGRHISTWETRYIPGHVMAMMAEDLSKGLAADDVTVLALAVCVKADDDDPKVPGEWPAWQYDLDLTDLYAQKIRDAFHVAILQIRALLRKWWDGSLATTRGTLMGLISEIVTDSLEQALEDLWTEAWHLGVGAAEAVITHQEPDWGTWQPGDLHLTDAEAEGLQAFIDTHGADILTRLGFTREEQIAETISDAVAAGGGPEQVADALETLLNVDNRSRVIARTEIGSAVQAASIITYRDMGVSYKMWITANDSRVCPVCRANQDEGPIPVTQPFQSGRMTPPQHPSCRCAVVPAPDVTKSALLKHHPGEKHVTCSRGHKHWGEHGAAGLLVRARVNGQYRYLLQKRSATGDHPNVWSLPGGALLQDEDAITGAYREAGEELGQIPADVKPHHTVVDDHGGWAFHTVVADSPAEFTPTCDGESPEETAGWAWLTAKEIDKLPLHPGFAGAWETVRRSRRNIQLGKVITRRVDIDGQEVWLTDADQRTNPAGGGGRKPTPHAVDGSEVPGGSAGSTAGGEPPRWTPPQGTSSGATFSQPVPRRQTAPDDVDDASFPHERARQTRPVSWPAGVSYMDMWPDPVLGTQQPTAEAPRGGPRGRAPNAAGKAANVVNNVSARRVYRQMRKNFPPESIQWVRRGSWEGPAEVPLNKVDFSNQRKWAAWHEKDRVKHFENLIENDKTFHPPVMIKRAGHKHLRIVDGHHRSMAYKNLNKPITAWIGTIPESDQQAADETHAAQEHQGSSPQNG